jgi:hypothetical protein
MLHCLMKLSLKVPGQDILIWLLTRSQLYKRAFLVEGQPSICLPDLSVVYMSTGRFFIFRLSEAGLRTHTPCHETCQATKNASYSLYLPWGPISVKMTLYIESCWT